MSAGYQTSSSILKQKQSSYHRIQFQVGHPVQCVPPRLHLCKLHKRPHRKYNSTDVIIPITDAPLHVSRYTSLSVDSTHPWHIPVTEDTDRRNLASVRLKVLSHQSSACLKRLSLAAHLARYRPSLIRSAFTRAARRRGSIRRQEQRPL